MLLEDYRGVGREDDPRWDIIQGEEGRRLGHRQLLGETGTKSRPGTKGRWDPQHLQVQPQSHGDQSARPELELTLRKGRCWSIHMSGIAWY